MFDALRNLIADLTTSDPEAATFEDNDYRLAAAALLFHIADVDGEVSAEERKRLKALVSETFQLDGPDATRLIAAAEKSEHEAVDFYHFTSVLKRALDVDGRRKIIEMLWQMAMTDGVVHEFEENVIWRVAELLGIPSRDRIVLRQQVAGDIAAEADDPPAAGPWSAKSDT
jgi:uncharacterized tellurite resistance protein B-like protein